jgi:methylmalonyl-CoA/ethylmalonyl-CoA epimerase
MHFVNDLEFEHIGVAINSIEDCHSIFGAIFELKEGAEIYEDILQNVKISFINIAGVRIELVEPLDCSRKSPVDNIVKKSISYYHLCFSTGCLEETVSHLIEKGAVAVTQFIPAAAFCNRKITFLYVKHLGLIELVEREK